MCCSVRPVDKDVTESLLKRAKSSGYTALIVTLDTMLLGYRPHDLATAYLPFMHGVGSQIGLSDPVFMGKNGKKPIYDIPEYPYDPEEFIKRAEGGDKQAQEALTMAIEWIKQVNSGTFRSWEQLKHVRDNWDGPLILKGILSVEVCLSIHVSVLHHLTPVRGCRTRKWLWHTEWTG